MVAYIKEYTDGAIAALNIGDNEDLKDAVAKKHSHANKTELDKIAEGDKAKWDAAAAKAHEHANKTELDKIAEGDKANLDAVVAALTVGTF